MPLTREDVESVKRKWMAHAPHLRWGDRVDARFLVAKAVRTLPPVRVLDVGCNAGIMLSEVPAAADRVGVDRSAEAIRLARALNPAVPFAVADMLALPFPDASFDVALFCGMLEVQPRAQQPDALRELARVVRPGGVVYLTTPNRRYPRARQGDGLVTYEELRELLHPYFQAEIRGFNPFPPFPYFLPNRLLARVPGIWPLLVALMERGVGTRWSCSFVVSAIKGSAHDGPGVPP